MFEFGKKTYIMGILNVTPDSFSDGGNFNNTQIALKHAHDMINEGADIIDIGGESTRPGHAEVDEDEETKRVLPIIKELIKNINVPISIDTYKANVAHKALCEGVKIVNDVWGLQRDKDMAKVIGEHNAYVVAMHNQENTEYREDIVLSIKKFFEETIELAKKNGIKDEKIILDPGIGFGKTPEQNMLVMRRLNELQTLGYPILLGTSRKSMIGKILDLPPKERVEGTIATTVMGIMQGIDIVRVHDVKENYRAVLVTDAIYRK